MQNLKLGALKNANKVFINFQETVQRNASHMAYFVSQRRYGFILWEKRAFVLINFTRQI